MLAIHGTAVITGASGGLGERFAWLFARGGYDVVLVARQRDMLEEIAAQIRKECRVKAHVVAADLSSDEGVQAVVKAVERKKLTVTALVNNAGFGAYGLFHKTDFAQERSMLSVNIVALTALTKALLPAMVKRKEGKVLNVGSLASFVPGPLMAAYYASKAYVLSFSVALQEELRGTGVTVTCLCPGPTKTSFSKAAHLGESKLFTRTVMDAETVARIGYRACMRGKGIVVAGRWNAFQAFATRFASRALQAKMARMAQERKQ